MSDRLLTVFALGCVAILAAGIGGAQDDLAPQSEDSLEHTLRITWSRGPNLPQGFQDSAGGVVGNTLISACGFCSGRNNEEKPGLYPRGFLKKVWGLDLDNEAHGWAELPAFPGAARQGMLAIPVEDALYYWGGFSYSDPYCYTDGYRLARRSHGWTWEPLPPLPWPLSGGMICALGSRIYVCGGADYDREAFYTNTDRNGENKRMGAQLMTIDTQHLENGWKPLAACPGTPRWVACMAEVQGTLYLIGGATGSPYCTVVDNWVYEPKTDTWTRIRDLPIATGNFPGGKVVFKDRYIVLGGGYQYDRVANPDGTTRDPYGTPGRFQDKGEYHNDIFVYDTETNLFGRADSMPLNNNLSMTILHDDELYLIGGETGGAVVEGEFYGHHPELFLKGKIQEAGG